MLETLPLGGYTSSMIVEESLPLGWLSQTPAITQKFIVVDAKTRKPITWGADIRVYGIPSDQLLGKGWSNEKGELTLTLDVAEGTPLKIIAQAGEYGEFLFNGMTGEKPITIAFKKSGEDEGSDLTIPILASAGVIVFGVALYLLLS